MLSWNQKYSLHKLNKTTPRVWSSCVGPLSTKSIDMIQQRAARWVKAGYRYTCSVSSTLTDLQWPSLWYTTRLKLFYNIFYHLSVLKMPDYFLNTTYPTRHYHPLHFEILSTRTNNYKCSYYPKCIHDWNNLPINTTESQSLELFL